MLHTALLWWLAGWVGTIVVAVLIVVAGAAVLLLALSWFSELFWF
jgi:hypothetical protein